MKLLKMSNFTFFHNFFSARCILKSFNLFPNDKSCKLIEFPDDNFKFDKNGRKFSERIENTAGKGEIARYEQFLLFPQCFQNNSTADTLKPGLVWERVNSHISVVFCSVHEFGVTGNG